MGKPKIEFWRIDDEGEIDFILDQTVGIEVKSTEHVHLKHLKGFERYDSTTLGSDRLRRKIIVSRDPVRRMVNGVEYFPIHDFLVELWSGGIFPTT